MSDRTDERLSLLIQETAKSGAGAGTEAQKIADYHASYLDEAAIESKGLAPLQRALDLRRGRLGPQGALARAGRHAARGRGRLQQHELLHGQPARPVDRAGPGRHHALPAASCCRARLDMPDRAYYLDASPRMDALRDQCRDAHDERPEAGEGARRRGRAARVFDLEKQHRGGARRPRTRRTSRRATTTGRGTTSDRRAPGSTGARTSREAGPAAASATSSCGSRRRVTGISALVGSQPIETWKDYLVFHTVDHFSSFLPEALRRGALRVPRDRPHRHAQAARPHQAGGGPHQPRAGRGGGPLVRPRSTSRPPPRPACRRSSPTSGRVRGRIDALDWMAPATKARAKAKLAVLKVGVGYPDHWRDYGGLDDRARRRAGQRRSASSCSSTGSALAQAGPAGGPVGVGDDAADGERGATCRP